MYGYEFVTPANKFINTMAGVFHAHPRMTGVVFALHTAVWALIAFAGLLVGGALKSLALIVAVPSFLFFTVLLGSAWLDARFDMDE